MAIYQIQINERTSIGRSVLAMLSAIPEVVTFEKAKPAKVEKSKVNKSIAGGFRDVRDILDGKQKGQTIDELLYELQSNID
ncbi:MAG: hypothetical protein LBS46_04330 [Dysgonamonadaceae bacterium]|jgi:hypothetical protein|nr:hypothetical protein [Dysgonamonadaceae bacterium]